MNKLLLKGLHGLTLASLMLSAGSLQAQSIHHSGKALPDAAERLEPARLALTNANVLDVRTGELLKNRTILLEGGKISSIGTEAPPKDIEVQDLNGYYVLPGFFDSHYHGTTLDAAWYALESGVTTVRSAGAMGMQDMAFRDAVAENYFPGPDMLTTGVYVKRQLKDDALEDPRLFKFMNVELQGEENLREAVGINFDRGADWIKTRVGGNTAGGTADAFWLYYSEKEIATIADEAGKHGGRIMCHIQGEEAAIVAARAGCGTIEHGQYITEKGLQAIKDAGAVWTPTYVSTEGFLLPHDDYNTPTARRVAPWILENQRSMLAKAHEMGVTMITGVDTGYAPDSVSRIAGEINSFIDYAGMTPLEAIRSATIIPAEVFKLDEETGSIEAGKEADLVIVERNPLEQPMNLHNPMMVISNGHVVVPFRSPYPGLDGRTDRSY
jgi:imidazolonepropionase-like amidohydrolase